MGEEWERPTRGAAEHQLRCWEWEESRRAQRHTRSQNSGCAVIPPFWFCHYSWHCHASWPSSGPSSSLASQGRATDMLFGTKPQQSPPILFRAHMQNIKLWLNFSANIYSALIPSWLYFFPPRRSLVPYDVKIHPTIQVSLGKLIKGIKTVTMGPASVPSTVTEQPAAGALQPRTRH